MSFVKCIKKTRYALNNLSRILFLHQTLIKMSHIIIKIYLTL